MDVERKIKKIESETIINGNYSVDIFDLIPEKINCLDVKHIDYRIHEMLSYHSYGRTNE